MGTVIPREEKTAAGVMLMALAVCFFTCIDTSAKWLILAGLPTLQVVFMRYLVHCALATLLYLPQEGVSALRSNSPRMQFLRSAFLLGSTVLNFTALKYLPITVTTTIMFSGPIAVTLLAIPILGERVGVRRIVAVCTGFMGVLVVIQPWGTEFHPAMFLCLGAMVSASMYFVMTRMLAGVEANSTQQIWSSGLAALALLPFVLGGWLWPQTPMQWTIFFAVGTFGAGGHIAATIAHRWADASILAPMIYIQVFTAAVAGILVFATWPTVWTLGGGTIIILSGLYIWRRERQKKRAQSS